ncbi:hypothetical protein [Rhodococcus spongiicola]|uniref:Secreted protein n=1 Tax=Rhodococcus spongiicola TaxID=2487352 RepID=A0A3S3AK35_9NOCA|nr:hypothetical protein [Rhodococcus spongiicola]RVW06574.1 hypothetical protein EF834_04000 [Rhodococcus spongiicola]
MSFIRKAMAVVAVTSGLVAGGSGIAQAASVEPSVQAVSAMTSPAPIADTGEFQSPGSLGNIVGSVVMPVFYPYFLMMCEVAADTDDLSLQTMNEACASFFSVLGSS